MYQIYNNNVYKDNCLELNGKKFYTVSLFHCDTEPSQSGTGL